MRHVPWRIAFLLAAPVVFCARVVSAQCPDSGGIVKPSLVSYPRTSDQYAVQYRIDGDNWIDANVFISDYGQTVASPYRNDSGYVVGKTSFSFVSIPARANVLVQLRVTKLVNGPFQASDRVAVRPTPKLVDVQTARDGSVRISKLTSRGFNGDQFILWWNRGADGGGIEGLAFFLNPPYPEPTGANVKVVTSPSDLDGLAAGIDTLDFESPTATPVANPIGAYRVPDNVLKVFLGPSAWVQGKLRFSSSSATRSISGPGVLDGSLFDYRNRNCVNHDGTPTNDGLYALSSEGNGLNHFVVDGIVISDHNHAANDPFFNSAVNNVKTLGWNSNNAALRLNDATTVSNVFVHSGDDSLMLWGTGVTVTNVTVWQGYNGGVVNLGWSNNSQGDNNLINGLWVVKTDWIEPTAQSWDALSQPGPPDPLNAQNNAVFASLMVPSTKYGQHSPPLFKNIYVEDPPQVLFSLKIAPSVNCPDTFCTPTFLEQRSKVSLNIENLYSPQSRIDNSIGFQTLPAGYIAAGGDPASAFPVDYTLTGTMTVGMTNVWISLPDGLIVPLTHFDAAWAGRVLTNGAVTLTYAP